VSFLYGALDWREPVGVFRLHGAAARTQRNRAASFGRAGVPVEEQEASEREGRQGVAPATAGAAHIICDIVVPFFRIAAETALGSPLDHT
jgi:hypothetical protein